MIIKRYFFNVPGLGGLWWTADVGVEEKLDSLSSVHRRGISDSGIDEQNAKCARPAFALCHLWQQAVVLLTVLAFVATCTAAGCMWLQSRMLVAEIVAPLGVIILTSGLFYANITLPRHIFNRLHDKVSNRDVARLRKDAVDPLKGTYFDVTSDVIKLPQQIEKTLAQNIRRSLHALGDAIDDVRPEEHEMCLPTTYRETDSARLAAAMRYLDTNRKRPKREKANIQPPVQPPLSNPTELKELAAKLLSEAATEIDPIVAASIKRRSASLVHQANTIDQIRTLNRRNKALRDEISQQMNSLNTRLNASHLMRGQAATGMADMFDQITHLASEASQVAAAQEELASALTKH